MDTEENVRRYWAFISYSHADKKWADWLHRSLEHYPMPRDLVGKPTPVDAPIPKRFVPVFRDREELPTATDLGAVISRALRHARFLVVICSPRGAKSPWVEKEIVEYKKMHGEDRVLCLIVEGEPWASDGKPGIDPEEECFPKAVRYRLGADGEISDQRTEPIAADARDHGDGKENAVIKLMAGLLGVGFDDLRRREQEFQRRKARRFKALAAVFAILFVSAVVAGVYAALQKREVQRTLSQADLQLAVVEREERDYSRSMAYLARSLRSNPNNRAAALSAFSALAHAKHHPPVGPVLRHSGEVADVFGTADGSRIVTAVRDGVYVWTRPDHRLLAEESIGEHRITALAEWPDGGGVVAGTEAGLIYFLSLDDFSSLRTPVSIGEAQVSGLRWDPTGGILGVAFQEDRNKGGLVILSRDGEELFRGTTEKVSPIGLEWSPDSAQVALWGYSPFFTVLTATGEGAALKAYKSELSPPALIVSGLAFTDNRTLQVVDSNAGLQTWNTETGEQIGENRSLGLVPGKVVFSEDRSDFLSVLRSTSAFLYELESARVSSMPFYPGFTVSDIAYLDSEHAILIGENGVAQVRRLVSPSAPVTLARVRYAFADQTALSQDEKVLASVYSDDTLVRFFNTQTLRESGRPVRLPVKVHGLTFLEDGKTLAGLGLDGKIYRVNWRKALDVEAVPEEPLLPEAENLPRQYGAFRFSHDGTNVAVPYYEGVVLIEMHTARRQMIEIESGAVAVAWSDDDSVLAAGTGDQMLRYFRTDGSPAEDFSSTALNVSVSQLAWSPDGRRMAILMPDYQVQVVQARTGQPVGTAFAVEDGCELFTWGPGSRWVLTSDFEGRLKAWDPDTGLAIARLPRTGSAVFDYYALDGRPEILVTADNYMALVPFPELSKPPSWVPYFLEAVAGTTLPTGGDAEAFDPDAWLSSQAKPPAGAGDVWSEMHRWMTDVSADRKAAPGVDMSEAEVVGVLDSVRQENEWIQTRRRLAELWNNGEQTEALQMLDRVIELDPGHVRSYQVKAQMGEARREPEMIRDACLGLAGAADATLMEVLEAKTRAARACLQLDEPDEEMARRLIDEVLAEYPEHEEAGKLREEMETR